MIDLIVFNVSNNYYALNIENIQRIVQSIELTDIPNIHSNIDGMMSYEDSVIKILNFRKLIGIKGYDEELKIMFENLKVVHKTWIDELSNSIEHNSNFTKTTDPHQCDLGIWLDSFNSYDDEVSKILKELDTAHRDLHTKGSDVITLSKVDREKALKMLKSDIYDTYNITISKIDLFIAKLDVVANSLQKLLIYEKKSKLFAIKVDSIKDIVHINESDIINGEGDTQDDENLELDGILDLDGVLVNVIKTVNLPK
jgi:chemotaxis signal transduction protein